MNHESPYGLCGFCLQFLLQARSKGMSDLDLGNPELPKVFSQGISSKSYRD